MDLLEAAEEGSGISSLPLYPRPSLKPNVKPTKMHGISPFSILIFSELVLFLMFQSIN